MSTKFLALLLQNCVTLVGFLNSSVPHFLFKIIVITAGLQRGLQEIICVECLEPMNVHESLITDS